MNEENKETKKELEILWTPTQVAKYLSISPITVYRWVSTGKMIDPTKIIRFSNRVRIPRSEVERLAGSTRTRLTDESSVIKINQ